MKLVRRISRAIARCNDSFVPTAAAAAEVQGEGLGGTHPDPLGLSLLRVEIERSQEDEQGE